MLEVANQELAAGTYTVTVGAGGMPNPDSDSAGGSGAGGSSGNNQLGANGGSGVVIIRYSAKPKGLTVIVR